MREQEAERPFVELTAERDAGQYQRSEREPGVEEGAERGGEEVLMRQRQQPQGGQWRENEAEGDDPGRQEATSFLEQSGAHC